jgi:serine/threonine-protein kinase SRPK3
MAASHRMTPHDLAMLNRVLSLAVASKPRLARRIQQCYKYMVHTQTDRTPPISNMSTPRVVENVELTFVEEPLGLRADQGYGYLQVDFGQRIGPGDRYEVLRKLGWGMNVR